MKCAVAIILALVGVAVASPVPPLVVGHAAPVLLPSAVSVSNSYVSHPVPVARVITPVIAAPIVTRVHAPIITTPVWGGPWSSSVWGPSAWGTGAWGTGAWRNWGISGHGLGTWGHGLH